MNRLRKWATPLVMGAFVLMATTGVLMFFHFGTPLGKELHEWGGWLFLFGVLAHIAINFNSLKLHWRRSLGKVLILAGIAVTVLAVLPLQNEERREGSRVVVDALVDAKLSELAHVLHRDPEELVETLRSQGHENVDADSTCRSLARGDQRAASGLLVRLFDASASR